MFSFRKTIPSFLFLILFSVVAVAQELTVDYHSTKLSTVLTDIQNKTGYHFVYNNSLVDVSTTVTATASGSLRQVLDSVLGNLPVEYEIIDKQIILSPVKEKAKSGKTTVSGVVVDDSGLPLPGVFVQEKGTQNGTSSDLDGRYSLTVSQGSTLVFSCLGLKESEQSVPRSGGRLDVQMSSDVNYLDEVVIVGYGVQKRANLTGAVSTINFSDGVDSRPITTASNALGGLAPGLAVTQTSGQPGEDGATLRVRGNTTLNTNSPLVLVDGIEYSMDNINPQDIESITVLKDASSTAIFGSRAANGVILVTTKSGASGKAHVTYTCNVDMQMPHLGGLGFVTDYEQSMNLVNEGARNLGLSHQYSDQTIELWRNAKTDPDGLNAYGVKNSIAYPNTDWFNELFRNGIMQKHNISVSGGTDNLKAYISVGYLDNQGVMSHHGLDSSTQKFDVRTNVEYKINNWLDAGVRLFGERQDYGMMNVSDGLGYLMSAIPGMYPGVPGKWGFIANDEESQNATNIFERMARTAGEKFYYRGYATAYLKAQLMDGLSLEFTGNHNLNLGYRHEFRAPTGYWDYVADKLRTETSLTSAWNEIKVNNSYKTNAEALLRYNKTFGKHETGLLAGYSVNHYISREHSIEKEGVSDWAITEMSSYTTLKDAGSDTSDWGLMSWFGRANYAYDGKYLLEANLRYDGSSRFAPESRWGLFPSFSAGWNISKEPWMKAYSSWLDNLKLRGSWGVTGNNNSGNYAWQSTFTAVNVVSGGTDTAGLIVTTLGNNSLVWETTKTKDIGVDFGFFGNRLTGEIDGYIRNTTGILFRPTIHLTMGNVTAPYENLASVQNRGIELGIKWRDGIGKDFSYSAGLNMAYNITTVKKYKGKLVQEWRQDDDGNDVYYNNIGDVAQSGFGGYILEDHVLGDQYLYKLYRGTGEGYSGSGEVDINAGPVDGMIRTQADMDWVIAMISAGYTFKGGQPVTKNTFYYGDFIYADLNGDGNYGDDNDHYFTGHSNVPKITAGLNLSARWKGFDVYALFTGAFGFYLNWNSSINTSKVNLGQAIPRRIADDHYYYDPAGDESANNINATYPRLVYNKSMNNESSDFYHYRGDYVKLKSIQFGYTLPKKIVEKVRTESCRIFVSGENLLTFTNYPGLDPEIGTSVGYPLMRNVCGGIQVTF